MSYLIFICVMLLSRTYYFRLSYSYLYFYYFICIFFFNFSFNWAQGPSPNSGPKSKPTIAKLASPTGQSIQQPTSHNQACWLGPAHPATAKPARGRFHTSPAFLLAWPFSLAQAIGYCACPAPTQPVTCMVPSSCKTYNQQPATGSSSRFQTPVGEP